MKVSLTFAGPKPTNQLAPTNQPTAQMESRRRTAQAPAPTCSQQQQHASQSTTYKPISSLVTWSRRSRNRQNQPSLQLALLLLVAYQLAGPLYDQPHIHDTFVMAKIHHSKRQAPEPQVQQSAPGAELVGAGKTAGRESNNWWNLWWQQYITDAVQPTVRPIVGVHFGGQSIELQNAADLLAGGAGNEFGSSSVPALREDAPSESGANLANVEAPAVASLLAGHQGHDDIERNERLRLVASSMPDAMQTSRSQRQMAILSNQQRRQQAAWNAVRPTIIQLDAASMADMTVAGARLNRQAAARNSPDNDDEELGIMMRSQLRASRQQQAQRQPPPRPSTAFRGQQALDGSSMAADELAPPFEQQQQNQMLDYSEEEDQQVTTPTGMETEGVGGGEASPSSETDARGRDSSSSSIMMPDLPSTPSSGSGVRTTSTSSPSSSTTRQPQPQQQQQTKTIGETPILPAGAGERTRPATPEGRVILENGRPATPSRPTGSSIKMLTIPSRPKTTPATQQPTQETTSPRQAASSTPTPITSTTSVTTSAPTTSKSLTTAEPGVSTTTTQLTSEPSTKAAATGAGSSVEGTKSTTTRPSVVSSGQPEASTTMSGTTGAPKTTTDSVGPTVAPATSKVPANVTSSTEAADDSGEDDGEDDEAGTDDASTTGLMNAAGGVGDSDADDDSDDAGDGDEAAGKTDEPTGSTVSTPARPTTQTPLLTTMDIERLSTTGPAAASTTTKSTGSSSSRSQQLQAQTATKAPPTTTTAAASSTPGASPTTASPVSSTTAAAQAIGGQKGPAATSDVQKGAGAEVVDLSGMQTPTTPTLEGETAITVPMDTLMRLMMNQIMGQSEASADRTSMATERPVGGSGQRVAGGGSTPSGTQESSTQAPMLQTTRFVPMTSIMVNEDENSMPVSELADLTMTTRKRLQPPPTTKMPALTSAGRPSAAAAPVEGQTSQFEMVPPSSSADSITTGAEMASTTTKSPGATDEPQPMLTGARDEPKIELINIDLMPIQRLMTSTPSSPMSVGGKTMKELDSDRANMIPVQAPQSKGSLEQQQMVPIMMQNDTIQKARQMPDVEPGMRLRPATVSLGNLMEQQQQQPMQFQMQQQPMRAAQPVQQAGPIYMIMMPAHSKKPTMVQVQMSAEQQQAMMGSSQRPQPPPQQQQPSAPTSSTAGRRNKVPRPVQPATTGATSTTASTAMTPSGTSTSQRRPQAPTTTTSMKFERPTVSAIPVEMVMRTSPAAASTSGVTQQQQLSTSTTPMSLLMMTTRQRLTEGDSAVQRAREMQQQQQQQQTTRFGGPDRESPPPAGQSSRPSPLPTSTTSAAKTTRPVTPVSSSQPVSSISEQLATSEPTVAMMAATSPATQRPSQAASSTTSQPSDGTSVSAALTTTTTSSPSTSMATVSTVSQPVSPTTTPATVTQTPAQRLRMMMGAGEAAFTPTQRPAPTQTLATSGQPSQSASSSSPAASTMAPGASSTAAPSSTSAATSTMGPPTTRRLPDSTTTSGAETNRVKLERLQQQQQQQQPPSSVQQDRRPAGQTISGSTKAAGKTSNVTSSFIPAKLRADFMSTKTGAAGQSQAKSASSLKAADLMSAAPANATTASTPALSATTTTRAPSTLSSADQSLAIRQFGGANRMSALSKQPVPFGRPATMTLAKQQQQPRFEVPTFDYGAAIAVRRPDEPLANGQVPNCTLSGKNFCVLTKDYPMNEVRQAVERSFRSVRIMYEELQTVSDQDLHKDDSNASNSQAANGKFACQTQVELMRPGWARDEITKEWMLVVNTDVFPQRVRTESCAQPNTPCEFIAPFYDSTCQQRYSLHRMIAIDPHDPTRSPQVAIFKFPAGCVCRVHPIRKNVK